VTAKAKPTPGVVVRHSRGCLANAGGTCSAGRAGGCTPLFEAWAYIARENRKARKSFATMREAKMWRAEAIAANERGKLRGPSSKTLREEAAEWRVRAEAGQALTRSGRPYKPGVIRGVEADFRLHLDEHLGAVKLGDLRRQDVQRRVEELQASGLSGSKVRGIVTSLKIVLRRPLQDDEMSIDPTERLRLPATNGARQRAATVDEVETLVAVLPVGLRPLYRTAAYAGLRRGELRGLKWEDVDLAGGVIHVRRSWDAKEGEITPKSSAGLRETPLPPMLRDELLELKASSGRSGADFVFGPTPGSTFTPTNVHRQAEAAWKKWNKAEQARAEEEGRDPDLLDPIGLHELRHTWVSFLSDAGFTLDQIAKWAGHSSSWMTAQYRHLLKGATSSAAERFGEYLERANTAARLAQVS
jgi:integrase